MTAWLSHFRVHDEDDQLLVVCKEAGVLTMGQSPHEPSVLASAKAYLRTTCEIENPFVAIVGRLDHPVSGLLLIAKSPEIADQLWAQVTAGSIRKQYSTIVEGRSQSRAKTLTNWLVKDRRHRSVSIVSETSERAQLARLSYQVVAESESRSELSVELHTGRKHQIRAQLAHHGLPIVGDRKYGATSRMDVGIALACTTITIFHPKHQKMITWELPKPPTWDGLLHP